ncbi:MAG: hypothetical protein QXQ29_00905, partial [Candidatus Bathyarchaeia archaeon]
PAGGFSACISGYIARKPNVGWMKAAVILAILVGCWYLTPIGFEAPLYPIPLHVTAIVLTLIFNKKLYSWLEESSRRYRSIIALFIAFLAGIMADHMWGNLMYILGIGIYIPLKTIRDTLNALGVLAVKMGLPNIPLSGLGDLFMFMLPVSTIERITMTVIATLIGLPVFRALKKYLPQI